MSFEELAELAELLGGRPRLDNDTYFIHWGNDEGVLWFYLDGDKVVLPFIQSHQRGTLGSLPGLLPSFFRERGFKAFVTSGSEPKELSYRWLLGIGFEFEREDGMLEGSILPGCRFEEYARWKQGGNEPDWHKDVVAKYGPGRTEA